MMTATLERLESRRLFAATGYVQTNLVSDGFVHAAHVDKDLKNPWGIAFTATGPFWISDNGTSKTTIYDKSGNRQFAVKIPGGGGHASAPTGQVFNSSSSNFIVKKGAKSGAALFIFAGEDGAISGWNSSVDSANAVIAVDNSKLKASYKGLAIGTVSGKPRLYAANFHSGVVEMYDGSFKRIAQGNAFKDTTLPKGYAPFNVQNLGNGMIGVTYALVGADGDDVSGANHGAVDLYTTAGVLIRRLVRGNYMNSPWGLTMAPSTFGKFANDLLVGEFGSGRITAFNPTTGAFIGYVSDKSGNPIHDDGLWALTFGNGGSAGSKNTLFFTAGLNHEADGLFGQITVAT